MFLCELIINQLRNQTVKWARMIARMSFKGKWWNLIKWINLKSDKIDSNKAKKSKWPNQNKQHFKMFVAETGVSVLADIVKGNKCIECRKMNKYKA